MVNLYTKQLSAAN